VARKLRTRIMRPVRSACAGRASRSAHAGSIAFATFRCVQRELGGRWSCGRALLLGRHCG
jgi:hypothetical protein